MMSNSGEVEAQVPVMEQPVAPEKDAPAAEVPAEQPEAVSKEEEKPVKERKQKAPREKKPKAPAHPPYFQMIKESITALNEKGGSSPYAIAKYIEEKHKAVLPANFRKILGLQLKNCVSKGKLMKIKASYKLTEAEKKKRERTTATTTATTTKAVRANAAKPKETTKKRKPKSRSVSKIDDPAPVTVTTRAKSGRTKKSIAAAKPKQLKSIRFPAAKKAKKASA